MIRDRQEFVARLQDLVGDGLRVVAVYDRDGYDAFYVREDATSRLSEIGDEIHGDLILQGIGNVHLEDLFDAGGLNCSMHQFDEVAVFNFVTGEYAGLFVSVDADVDVPLATFVETCKQQL